MAFRMTRLGVAVGEVVMALDFLVEAGRFFGVDFALAFDFGFFFCSRWYDWWWSMVPATADDL